MSDQLIDDYLHELKVSAWIRRLPAPRTAALENEVRERIAAELAATGKHDEATVYAVLDRLGPPSDFVADEDSTPAAGADRAMHTVLTPVARLHFTLASRGWGVADIGSLLLLIVGPFILWWIGPIFGIILVRTKSDRWSDHATHVATVIVFTALAIQAVVALAVFALVLIARSSDVDALRGLLSAMTPGHLRLGPLFTSTDTSVAVGPLFVVRIVVGLLAPIAGVSSGIYLALSPRYRR
jgi:hypothetical protein